MDGIVIAAIKECSVEEVQRAEEFAKWVIRNVSSLMSMLDKEGERDHFLDRLDNYVQDQLVKRTVPKRVRERRKGKDLL